MKLMKRDRENRKHRFRRVNSRYVSTVVEYHKKCFLYLTCFSYLPDERIAKICKEFISAMILISCGQTSQE